MKVIFPLLTILFLKLWDTALKAHIKAEDVVKLLIDTKKIVDGGGYL